MALTSSQVAAIRHVDTLALHQQATSVAEIGSFLADASVDMATLRNVSTVLMTEALVELNFHPDRKSSSGATVAGRLLAEGIYRNQFETQISNGSRSAHSTGQRFDWEHRIFAGAYDNVPNAERPKYGALNLLDFPDGPAPRFGSCFICLRPSVSQRTTFSYGDSVSNPTEVGTLNNFDSIWSAMLHDVLLKGNALGLNNITIPTLLEHIEHTFESCGSSRFDRMPGRTMDHYIEAQVHGDIRLDRDVEKIVADPSYKNSDIGNILYALLATTISNYTITKGLSYRWTQFPTTFEVQPYRNLQRELLRVLH